MTERPNAVRTTLLRQTARSTRVRYAVLTTGLSSAGGFSISVALAHRSSPTLFGQFAVAMAVSTLAVGFAHATVAEPLIGLRDHGEHLRAAGRRSALIGAITTMGLATAGAVVDSPMLLWAGIGSFGLVAYDLSKTVAVAVGQPLLAFRMELLNFSSALCLSVLVLTGHISPTAGFAAWIVLTGLIGIAAAHRSDAVLMPGWPSSEVATSTALTFGGDYLVGSGSSQLITTVLGATGRLQLVAALRAGGTLMGPVTMAIGMARTLLIPWLRHRHASQNVSGLTVPRGSTRGARQATAMMVGLAAPPLVFIAFLPPPVGSLILGQNWTDAQPLLPFLALEALLNIIGATPFAGHRTHLAGRRSLLVRVTVCAVRCCAVVGAGMSYGAIGAAAAMAATALLSSVLWWMSYTSLVRRSGQ